MTEIVKDPATGDLWLEITDDPTVELWKLKTPTGATRVFEPKDDRIRLGKYAAIEVELTRSDVIDRAPQIYRYPVDTPPPPPPPPPPVGTVVPYGCPWYGSSLGNLENGKNKSLSYGVVAPVSGKVKSVTIFLIFRASGYYSGDGGDWQTDWCSDNGGKVGAPMCPPWISRDPMSLGNNAAFPKMGLPATIKKGDFYWLNFTNPSSSPTSNWVSIDDLYSSGSGIPNSPGAVAQKMKVLQNGGENKNHCPVFSVEMEDGTRWGAAPIIDCPSRYDFSSRCNIVFTPAEDRSFTELWVKVNGSGTLTAKLAGKEGHGPIKSGWFSIPLVASVKKGQAQRLEVGTMNGNFTWEALQFGVDFYNPFPGYAEVAGRKDVIVPFCLT